MQSRHLQWNNGQLLRRKRPLMLKQKRGQKPL